MAGCQNPHLAAGRGWTGGTGVAKQCRTLLRSPTRSMGVPEAAELHHLKIWVEPLYAPEEKVVGLEIKTPCFFFTGCFAVRNQNTHKNINEKKKKSNCHHQQIGRYWILTLQKWQATFSVFFTLPPFWFERRSGSTSWSAQPHLPVASHTRKLPRILFAHCQPRGIGSQRERCAVHQCISGLGQLWRVCMGLITEKLLRG